MTEPEAVWVTPFGTSGLLATKRAHMTEISAVRLVDGTYGRGWENTEALMWQVVFECTLTWLVLSLYEDMSVGQMPVQLHRPTRVPPNHEFILPVGFLSLQWPQMDYLTERARLQRLEGCV